MKGVRRRAAGAVRFKRVFVYRTTNACVSEVNGGLFRFKMVGLVIHPNVVVTLYKGLV